MDKEADDSAVEIGNALSDGVFTFKAAHSGKCLDVSGASTANGAAVQQWSCNGSAAQTFKIESIGDGYSKITNTNSGKALDIAGVSREAGAALNQWDYVGGANQQFSLVSLGGNSYSLRVRHTGMALDVSGAGQSDGAPVLQWPSNDGKNQTWLLESAGGSTGTGGDGDTATVVAKKQYGPLGETPGSFFSRWSASASCPAGASKGTEVFNTNADGSTKPLFPFNEPLTVVLRGPMKVHAAGVYTRVAGMDNQWARQADAGSISWKEYNWGPIVNASVNLDYVQNGREIFTDVDVNEDKAIVFEVTMPTPTDPPYLSVSQNDVPAIWLLNKRLFTEGAQYGCNCRGVGDPGGCGELDVAEVIPSNKGSVITQIYSYERQSNMDNGATVGARPTSQTATYAAIFRTYTENGKRRGMVYVEQLNHFSFGSTVSFSY